MLGQQHIGLTPHVLRFLKKGEQKLQDPKYDARTFHHRMPIPPSGAQQTRQQNTQRLQTPLPIKSKVQRSSL